LKSRFNGELENKLFVLANEIKADFREGNSTYERLKMYVTDKEIRFEDKNIKARTIPNFFNIWIHSNNDVPLQIQGSDRRYTVFNTKSIKLTEVSKELGYEHISDFISQVKKERDGFLFDVMSLKYDMAMATSPLATEEKELIYEASMSKIEILSDKLKKQDIEYFEDNLEDFFDSDDSDKDDFREIRNSFNNHRDFIKKLSLELKCNYLTNELSRHLYRIFINAKESNISIGKQFNKHLGKAKQQWHNGGNIKYRVIDKDKDVVFGEPKTHKEVLRELDKDGNLIVEDVKVKKRPLSALQREAKENRL